MFTPVAALSPYRTIFTAGLWSGISPSELGSLVYSVVFVCLCWLPIYAMYRKRIFLKV